MLAYSVIVLAAVATSSPPAANGVHPLRYHLLGDSIATGVGAAAWISTETVFKNSLAPSTCRWCDRAADGTDTLNPVDRWGTGIAVPLGQQKTMDFLSGVVGFVALPVAVFGLDAYAAHRDGALDGLPVDVLISAEAVVTALTLNQTVKFIAGRERPFVHKLPDAQKPLTAQPADNYLSFFSGHSTFAFSVLCATATVADLRGYSFAKWIWIVGAPLAVATPLMRMMADKHYLTDVVTGSLVGAAVGIGLPRLLHGRADAGPQVTVVPTGNGVDMNVRF